jgi:hypothetical protein
MIDFKHPQDVCHVWSAMREGIESGSQDHILSNAALDLLIQFVLDVAAPHHDRTAGVTGLCAIVGQVSATAAHYPFRMMWFAPLVGGTMVVLVRASGAEAAADGGFRATLD